MPLLETELVRCEGAETWRLPFSEVEMLLMVSAVCKTVVTLFRDGFDIEEQEPWCVRAWRFP